MPLSIWTMAPENDFLDVLAKAVRYGFPLHEGEARPPLMQWTILVPTRRAARLLQDKFESLSATPSVILPKVRPIGDIDEDAIEDGLPQDGVPEAISKQGEIFQLLGLVTQWARDNPQFDISQDVLASGAQAFQLTLSLLDLVHQCETEERGFGSLPEIYGLDLAGHRNAILSLLEVISEKRPQQLELEGLIGPNARRNIMIRLQAKRIRDGKHRGPIIAAGSTGTNPATRDLLLAIAGHPQGAVVLPGLDQILDEHSWAAITPEHPQFALKTLLSQWQVKRDEVQSLGADPGHRTMLASLALRPAATTDTWAEAISACAAGPLQLLQDVTLIEAANRQEEARVIALAFRKQLADGEGTAALITPDRDLARRVVAEAARWNMDVDDSSGEALSRRSTGLLCTLLVNAIVRVFDSESLLALLNHGDCTLGWPRAEFELSVQLLEITCFRAMPAGANISTLVELVEAAHHQKETDSHLHPIIERMSDDDWVALRKLALELASLFKIFDGAPKPLALHVDHVQTTLQALAPDATMDDAVHKRLLEVLESLRQASRFHPEEPFQRASHSITHALATETLRNPMQENARLAIYGLLEARFVSADLTILGGLVETSWPAVADGGPWLNRPMRENFGLQQPERDIGTTAHDFSQAFGQRKVIIAWPRKLGSKPAIPSRWIVRLRMVLQAMGLDDKHQLNDGLLVLARALDRPKNFRPTAKPKPKPPVAIRPKKFSVTAVETLVRDSYAIYAKRILELEPLPDLNEEVDASLRGNLIHEALQLWAVAGRTETPEQSVVHLLAKGEQVFAPYMTLPEVKRFWWPRFARMAREFAIRDFDLRIETEATLTEVKGRHEFKVTGIDHVLTARADRIDVQIGNRAAIYDYKSGSIPSQDQIHSGFAPQLVLEAAMAMQGAFGREVPTTVQDAAYLGVSGGTKEKKHISVGSDKKSLAELAPEQFERFRKLLERYLDASVAYLPRHNLQKEGSFSKYDHLSRFYEWRQSEGNDP